MTNNLDEYIEHFFEDNSETHPLPYHFSTLYLIVRDVKACLKLNPNVFEDEAFNTYGAEWPAIMTIFSGIDLLGKFLAGDDSNGNVGNRFKEFIIEYFDECNNRTDSEIIYELRNSLAHSFNLYSRHYNFSLVNNENEPLILDISKNSKIYKQINVNFIYLNFRSACFKYQSDVLNTNNIILRSNFDNMYNKYGKTFQY